MTLMIPTEFREACRRAGISDDKPLAAVMATLYETAVTAKEAVQGGARGLTPEGEAELIQKIVATVDSSVQESANKHRLRLERTASMIAGGILAASLLIGISGGYWWGWRSADAAITQTEERIAAAFRHGGTAAGQAWLKLMQYNDPVTALDKCSGSSVWSTNGRQACLVPLWLDGPGAPHR